MDRLGSDSVIDARGLRKRFGSFTALDGLDLTVRAGEVAGFLGPNGAGKSTTIRVLLGLIRRDSGDVTVFGADPFTDAVDIHRRLAYVPGDVTLWPHMTGGECIDMLLAMRGIRGSQTPGRAELIDRFELDPTKKSDAYSKGNRQKVALIAALCADTELLVLDEPTSGLDPLMTREFERAVADRAAQGTAVLMSSHLLSEVEEMCSTVTIVRDGRTVLAGELSRLRNLRRSRVSAMIPGGSAALSDVDGVDDMTVVGDHIEFSVDPALLSAVLARLGTLDVRGLTVAPPSLEDLFLQAFDVTPGATP
ncbi:ABC-2 type transport system ATP-binding protein [Gordonia malaquae]|uniref:Putative ABC transporter ATP-binding protein n=1 Tax=Gordonia malaquae NBRC 108250 TaxID=1223542 RepID=M3VH05_GORML|nr:ABC transporter ATP-binding protein [Gordonia malaquae]GAC81459.1 putative ABC transporter ATP-binding protein [Gordonia malaquae NBRC 108250]SEB90538.1 ABC-2 type transport system ATP-binding protein [Gordonia malaquae]